MFSSIISIAKKTGVFIMKYEESDRVELKREMVKDLDKEIIAFLNAHGGTIYIGVDDNGNVVGIPQGLRDEYDEKVSAILTNNIKPNSRNKVDFSYNANGVLAIYVKEGDSKPYYLTEKGPKPSGTYIRVGRSKRPATDDEILTMIRDSSGWLWEKDKSPNQNLTFTTAEIYFNSKHIEFGKDNFLTLGIVDLDGNYTNLGLLISEECPIEIKFASYDEHLNFLKKKEFSGSIIKMADQVLEYAEMMNTTSAVIVPYQAQRIETQSFPGVSLRETILNAICHADYSFPSNIKIEFFKDKAQISNPGSIYKYSLNEVLRGQQSFRNPGLVKILHMLGFIENYGKGLKRINEAYQNEEHKPILDNLEHSFIVELPDLNFFKANNDRENVRNDVLNVRNDVLNHENISDEDKIIEAIKKSPNIKQTKLAEIIGKSNKTVARVIGNSKKIRRVGSNRTGHWEIVEEKNED